ncbi:MAG: MogA/MoaB family molybdenum cofactor biosynthesis protein [Candidatus Latescibacteria bacterium]|nr:MogA/MoaB family molybdenum cofactor biosynthesis protein [bacterium]MBD3425082.1 MogA/MoaB family molybdenum cofactor biosynthesis protein [Candidatus Latescibacterota bacterium]
MKVLVLTVSDRAAGGIYRDRSGPAIQEVLTERIGGIEIEREIIPDDRDLLVKTFGENRERDVIITTGGTGLGPRDFTPEATAEFCEKMVPGIAEYLRARSFEQTPHAALSRAAAGISGDLLIINFPGSVKGAVFCAEVISELLEHALEMIRGAGH